MKRTIIIAAAIALAALLSGCTGDGLFGAFAESYQAGGFEFFKKVEEKGREVEQKVIDAGAKAMTRYCDHVPGPVRSHMRDRVNSSAEAAGNHIEVTCVGDQPAGADPGGG